MKSTFITLILLAFIYISCATQKPVAYEFPAEMSAAIKTDYINQCEKGRILYEINCAGCHTHGKGRNTQLPGFTEAQLQGYHIREGNVSHETKVSEERVNAEELTYIVTFLSYRSKNKENTYTPKINEHEHKQ